MTVRFEDYRQITDDDIIRAWATATEVQFSARRFNYIAYRQIGFGDLSWWLPLERVLPLIGITPQMLRPVFNPQRRHVDVPTKREIPRRFPFNRRWFGLNRRTTTTIIQYEPRMEMVELPALIETYSELGTFPLDDKPFLVLAKIFNKSIKVLREDGGTGEHCHLFTVHPSGEIEQVA